MATIVGLGVSTPRTVPQTELWDRFFGARFGDDRRARVLWKASGVERRHGVVVPFEEDVTTWDTGRRMERFVREAVPLGVAAVEDALSRASVSADEVDLLAVASCTGYATPGLDLAIAERLHMRTAVERLHVGHMGCYAALPTLRAAADAVDARGVTAVVACVELPSLHVGGSAIEPEEVAAHALFSDAAAAATLLPAANGWKVLDVRALTDRDTARMMTWDVTATGFRMGLSPEVPRVLDAHVEPLVKDLLASSGAGFEDVRAWAVHPGGPRILDVVASRLGLAPEDVDDAAAVLREHGNCSSPTVLMVLDRLTRGRAYDPGDLAVMMAFGPGLTLYAALLEWQR